MFSVVVISANCENASCIPPFCTLQVATKQQQQQQQHGLLYQHHLHMNFHRHSVTRFVTSAGATVIS